MKKTVVSLIILLALSIQVFGQNINTVLSGLSKHENVEKISIGSFGMFFAKMAGGIAGGKEVLQGMKGIKSIDLLTLNNECTDNEKAKIREQLKNLKDDGVYSVLMNVKDGNDMVRFFVKQKKDTIKEILMIVLSGDNDEDTVVIRLKGNFKASDLARLVEKSNQKKDGR